MGDFFHFTRQNSRQKPSWSRQPIYDLMAGNNPGYEEASRALFADDLSGLGCGDLDRYRMELNHAGFVGETPTQLFTRDRQEYWRSSDSVRPGAWAGCAYYARNYRYRKGPAVVCHCRPNRAGG